MSNDERKVTTQAIIDWYIQEWHYTEETLFEYALEVLLVSVPDAERDKAINKRLAAIERWIARDRSSLSDRDIKKLEAEL